MLVQLPKMIDAISASVARITKPFVETRIGKIFLSVILLGPLTFLPTIYEAWTAPNIDALRTFTWPFMIVVNVAVLLSVVHNGDWRMRLVMFVWVLTMAAVWVATLVR